MNQLSVNNTVAINYFWTHFSSKRKKQTCFPKQGILLWVTLKYNFQSHKASLLFFYKYNNSYTPFYITASSHWKRKRTRNYNYSTQTWQLLNNQSRLKNKTSVLNVKNPGNCFLKKSVKSWYDYLMVVHQGSFLTSFKINSLSPFKILLKDQFAVDGEIF